MEDQEIKEELISYLRNKGKKIAPFFDIISFTVLKDNLIISCDSFIKERLKSNYQKDIEKFLSENFNETFSISYEEKTNNNSLEEKEQKPENHKYEKIKKESKTPPKNDYCKLNPLFTFDTFIEGQNNSNAKKMAKLTTSHLGNNVCNPFLILGKVGMGKTHLMQAIAHQILEDSPNSNVIFVNSQYLVDALYNNIEIRIFKKDLENSSLYSLFKKADAFLIDDIHLFKGKDALQHELYCLFEYMIQHNKQICFTCDRPVSEIHSFQERLISRINGGIKADLSEPTSDVRYKILKQLFNQMKNDNTFSNNLEIEEDVFHYFSENMTENIREMQGIFKSFLLAINFNKNKATLGDAEEYLKYNDDSIKNKKIVKISIDSVLRVVCDFYDVKSRDVLSKKRTNKVSNCRHIISYIARELTSLSSTEIGNFLGREHSTILHGIERIENLIVHDKNLQNDINNIKKEITKSCL